MAQGNGDYTLTQEDVEHLSLQNEAFGLQFDADAAKLQHSAAGTDQPLPQNGEAKAYFNDTPYDTLDAAVDALNASAEAEKTLVLAGDETLSKTITLSSGTLEISSQGSEAVKVTRAAGFKTAAMIRVTGGELTVENVRFDGAAAWSGQENAYLQRGTSTQNDVSAPLLNLSGGKVTLGTGSALQNNSNPSGAGGINMSGGTLVLAGGSLLDCYGGSHGGALYATGSGSTILIQAGEVKGNQAKTSSGGLCVDSGAKLTIEGGTIRNNYTRGRAGGLFINGTFVMTGGPDSQQPGRRCQQ